MIESEVWAKITNLTHQTDSSTDMQDFRQRISQVCLPCKATRSHGNTNFSQKALLVLEILKSRFCHTGSYSVHNGQKLAQYNFSVYFSMVYRCLLIL